jgi:CheY-like chemotaxis protein
MIEDVAVTQTIVLVEDDAQLRQVLEMVLREEGFNVKLCPNGQAAMDYLSAAKQSGEKLPAMIILDLNMPLVDGWAVAKWLDADEKLGEIPVIVTSATREQGEKAQLLHADAFLVKPFTTDEIIGIVELFSLLSP